MTAVHSPLAFERVPIESGRAALALAAHAWPALERESQLAAIAELVAAGRTNDFIVVAAHRGAALVGAVLAQLLPGRSAVVWPPQLAAGAPSFAAASLLQALDRHLAAAHVVLAQSLFEQPADPIEVNGPAWATLQAAGFVHAGDLLYMGAEAVAFPAESPELTPPKLELELETWSPANHERLIRVVESTYRGSLDCPLIDGLRETQDVLAGYRAVGQFRAELWMIARWRGSDVGCLLLADHPAQEQLEIVYLGVTPNCRGRGFGLGLTRHAQWQARKAGRARLVLAVDATNRPAIDAYRAAGFVTWDRRRVLVRSFHVAASCSKEST